MDHESRLFKIGPVSVVRAAGKLPIIKGYAALFETFSQDLGGFREKIKKGAFEDGLSGDIRSYFNHDPNQVLGRVSNGTLKVSTDERGLLYEVQPPDTQAARDLVTQIERGDISDASFRFTADDDVWETVEGENIRTVVKATVYELGPVSEGAYVEATSAVRSMERWKAEGEKTDDDGCHVDNLHYKRLLDEVEKRLLDS